MCTQFLIGSVLSTIFWTFGLVKKPEMDATFVSASDKCQAATPASVEWCI